MSKLGELTEVGNFRAKVEGCLTVMKALGEDPVIADGLRTLAQQREKVRMGYSKTLASLHLPGTDGLSRAADIVDGKKGWNASRRFWMIVGAYCEAKGLGWGGIFGLGADREAAVRRAFVTLRKAGWPEKHPAYQVSLGWDVAHVQQRSNWR